MTWRQPAPVNLSTTHDRGMNHLHGSATRPSSFAPQARAHCLAVNDRRALPPMQFRLTTVNPLLCRSTVRIVPCKQRESPRASLSSASPFVAARFVRVTLCVCVCVYVCVCCRRRRRRASRVSRPNNMTKMADGVDIDLYADDLEQDFAQVNNM